MISDGKKVWLIPYDQICHISVEHSYAVVNLSNGKKIVSADSLSHLDAKLNKYGFFRIHKSHIISLNQVDSFELKRTGIIHLKNGDSLNLAARRKKEFQDAFKSYVS